MQLFQFVNSLDRQRRKEEEEEEEGEEEEEEVTVGTGRPHAACPAWRAATLFCPRAALKNPLRGKSLSQYVCTCARARVRERVSVARVCVCVNR